MLPTEGCVALARPHLVRLLQAVKRDAVVSVRPKQLSSENKKWPGMPKHRAEFRARLGEGARSGEDADREP
jgi:hypothetical protein